MSKDAEMPQTEPWYVALLKTNGFERAVTNLTQQGFETFMPMQKKSVRHARQLTDVFRPVFPGYLFIRFGQNRADWRKINSTFGVSRLVSFEESRPAPVPQALMNGLQARCDAKNCLQSPDDLKIGEQVRMVSGAFAGFVGEIEKLIGEDRIRLLYEFMGQKSHIDIDKGNLEKL